MNLPTLNDVQSAAQRIDAHIHITPVYKNKTLDSKTQAQIYLKCENFQKTGAFKIRGATNTILSLSSEKLKNGVITHSSGNHGAAVARAASAIGVKSIVVAPKTAPPQKIAAIKQYGAEVMLCEPTLASRESTTNQIIQKTGATLIHPYNDCNIIAGQGTAALEFIGQVPDLDVIMGPIGGGGLMSGTSIVAKSINPKIDVIGSEPKNADDAYQSLKSDVRVTEHIPNTIADGLLTVLGPLTFAILQKYLQEIITVTEEDIIAAMRFIWERMKIIIEPSSAVPVAALFANIDQFKGKKVGIIISGGNVDLEKLPWNK